MDRTQEQLDVSLTEKSKLLCQQDPLRYHTTGFQETDHALPRPAASVNLSEGSSGEPFLFVPSPQDLTGQALKRCEKWVLEPYRFLLKILGWIPFTRDQDGDSVGLKVTRGFLILFWLGVITAGFVSQIVTCFRRDTIVPGTTLIERNGTFNQITCEEHLISSFVLPDIVLIVSYIFAFYLFSRGETEYLSNLAEKAFVKNSQTKHDGLNQWITGTMSFFFVMGVSWIFLSLVVRILSALSVRLFTYHTIVSWSSFVLEGPQKLGLIILSLVGFVFFDMLYVAVVLNHAAQSEMNIHLLRAIGYLVRTKQYDSLDTAIKDIMECRKYLRVLNGKTAAVTACSVLFNLGSTATVSLITLNDIRTEPLQRETLATVTSGLNAVLWITLISVPFIQAARVTHAAELLKETGPAIRARPMQYINTSQQDLDSYLQLTQAVRLRAKMFGIPIYPWMMYTVLVTFTFTMLVLCQFGVYNFTVYL